MSFDIFFQRCRFVGDSLATENATAAPSRSMLCIDAPSAAEVEAVSQLLFDVGATRPDEYGCCVIELADGGSAELYCMPLATDCMARVWGITGGLVRFLYDLLTAANWVMIPVMEDAVAVAAPATAVSGLPDRFPTIVVYSSVDQLGALLTGGFDTWAKYRDQVVDGG